MKSQFSQRLLESCIIPNNPKLAPTFAKKKYTNKKLSRDRDENFPHFSSKFPHLFRKSDTEWRRWLCCVLELVSLIVDSAEKITRRRYFSPHTTQIFSATMKSKIKSRRRDAIFFFREQAVKISWKTFSFLFCLFWNENQISHSADWDLRRPCGWEANKSEKCEDRQRRARRGIFSAVCCSTF